jgi:hypothetical protein
MNTVEVALNVAGSADYQEGKELNTVRKCSSF